MGASPIRSIAVLGVIAVVAACAGSAASPAASPAISAAAGGDELTGKAWQWTGSTLSGATTVSDPTKYTIEFGADGTFAAKVDCNQVSGQYTTTSSGDITITPGPSTLAACPQGSQADVYIAALSGVTNYGITDGNLVLTTTGGTMTFS